MIHPRRLSAIALILLASLPAARADELDDAVRQVRMGKLVVEAAPGAAVRVEQLRHEFWFGAALASQVFSGGMDEADAAKYREVFLANFTSAATA